VAASEALRAVFEAMENAPKAKMAKVESPKPKIPMPESDTRVPHAAQKRAGLVLVSNNDNTQASVSRADRSKSPNLKGLESQRQPVSSRKRSASVPATSPVTKITRRASAGVAAAIAR
jgi:hypothetical protein